MGKSMLSLGGMGSFATIFVLILCSVTAHSSHRNDEKAKDADCSVKPLLIKFTTNFEPIWDDEGSDAGGDLSIWRPTSRKAGFFPVGDTAVTSHESPDHAAVLVEDDGTGLVKPPRKFRKIWSDKGSSARRPVTIYEMIPPSNYTCLGDVAMKSYKRSPDRNMYRCIRMDLMEKGDIFNLWKSKHFGAKKDVSFWILKERNSTMAKAPPRGKRTQEEKAAAVEQDAGQDRAGEGSFAGPSVTSGGGASAEVEEDSSGEEAVQVPAESAVRVATVVAGSDAPSRPTRKELAQRARQRRLEATVAEYRRLVALEEEEMQSGTTSSGTAVSSSALPGSASQRRRSPAVRSRVPAATRHRRRAAKTSAAPHSGWKKKVHRLTLRVSHLEQELLHTKTLLETLRKEHADLASLVHSSQQ